MSRPSLSHALTLVLSARVDGEARLDLLSALHAAPTPEQPLGAMLTMHSRIPMPRASRAELQPEVQPELNPDGSAA